MRYSLIRAMDVSNGDGLGVSLFVQGCPFHCKGCFNQETWDFAGGKEWDEETEERFLELISKPYIKRVSILGGEPLANENVGTIYRLLSIIRQKYSDKKIWLFTGFTLEEMFWDYVDAHSGHPTEAMWRINLLNFVDVLADGRFVLSLQDINNKQSPWIGSTNQRVIDIPKSLKSHNIVLYGKTETGGD